MKHEFGVALVALALAACSAQDDGIGDPTFEQLDAQGVETQAIDGDLIAEGEDEDEGIMVHEDQIARIIHDGGEVKFLVAIDGPAAGEVTMVEQYAPDEDGMLHVRSESLTPLETFLELTDSTVPVPQALLDSEPGVAVQLAVGRDAVTSLDEPVQATIGSLTSETKPQAWSAAYMCSEGQTSAQFLNEICSIDPWWDQLFCHNGTWYSVTDNANGYVNWARGRTLACGANGKMRHSYKFGGIWYHYSEHTIPSGNVHYTTKTPITNLRRKVRHRRTASGFVRAATQFHRF
ncbi:MAG: hypothetical protein K0V04_43455 [Deltaproteobacteria bacterium]|nr:hypothetical protein [Deltaproteobacteria bacterium]